MIPAFILTLTAQVPAICEIRTDELYCNAEYSLYIESSDGARTLIEQGGPTIRALAMLPEGSRYIVEVSRDGA